VFVHFWHSFKYSNRFFFVGVITYFNRKSLLKSARSMVVQGSTNDRWFTPVSPDVLTVGDTAFK
jgi:hypothetical protein